MYDATVHDPEKEKYADVVLMDVPCSGLGVMGPRATAVEENTPITVSLARAERRRTRLNSRANTTAKITAAQVGSLNPQMAPMAMPVKAEWPRASEKKDIRLWTTMVDSTPNRVFMFTVHKPLVLANRAVLTTV